MRKGVSFKKLSNADSYLAHYYTQKDVLFNQYGPSVALVFDEPNNYSDPAVSSQHGRLAGVAPGGSFIYTKRKRRRKRNFS